ncbi:NUDIX hydrolase [bacterium]|nr:NUDIX hydrolase [bacterium]
MLKRSVTEKEKQMRPQTPALTVDAVINHTDGGIILIKRGHEPFKDCWALPGGFVDIGETVEDACIREAKEETGLDIRIDKLLGVYSDPTRDPRGHTVSVVFLCTTVSGEPVGGDDASLAQSFNREEMGKIDLAFDHKEIMSDAGMH